MHSPKEQWKHKLLQKAKTLVGLHSPKNTRGKKCPLHGLETWENHKIQWNKILVGLRRPKNTRSTRYPLHGPKAKIATKYL